MASEGQSLASAQQPFAQPQPAPISISTNTAPPPMKPTLKKWWRGIKQPQKLQENLSTYPNLISPSNKYSSFPRPPKFLELDIESPEPVARGFSTKVDLFEPLGVPVAEGISTCARNALNVEYQNFPTYNKELQPLQAATRSMNPYAEAPIAISASKVSIVTQQGSGYDSTYGSSRRTSLKPAESSQDSNIPRKSFLERVGDKLCKVCNAERENANVQTRYAAIDPPQQRARGIFGVPLRQSITYANVAISLVDSNGVNYVYGYVPIVVAKCGVFLKEKATGVEGIFRLSGSEKRIKQLKDLFDSPDRYGKGLDWGGFTVHDAANVLRRYLNQLPEPVVPLDLYDRFRQPLQPFVHYRDADEGPVYSAEFDLDSTIVQYQQLITELPPLNRQLLLYILDLLAVFASKANENRMTAFNLSTIFQVCLIRHPAHDMAPQEHKLNLAVLIFLIENQDNFLIGMRGTETDEQTVQEVQDISSPIFDPPTTPERPKITMGRSPSSASAGADCVRRYGGVRRNMSTSSHHSRQSNGAPSPASPALAGTSSSGVHRSNTLPSKRSPGLSSTRLGKHSDAPSPSTAIFATGQRGLSPVSPGVRDYKTSQSSPLAASAVESSLAPSLKATPSAISEERLLAEVSDKHTERRTPSRERSMSVFFSRSPTTEADKRAPNKLRKKIKGSASPSAHSSTHSLTGQKPSASPGLHPTTLAEQSHNEQDPSITNTDATPPLTQTPRAERTDQSSACGENPRLSTQQLKPLASPTSSCHSRSSFNDQSDFDRIDDTAATNSERAEKRSRWRLTRKKDDSMLALSPKEGTSDAGGATSTSSVASFSKQPRKSLTVDAPPSESTLISSENTDEKKGGPLGWIKHKMLEKREESREKEAEKERNKSRPPCDDRQSLNVVPLRGKSIEIKRDETVTARESVHSQQPAQTLPPTNP